MKRFTHLFIALTSFYSLSSCSKYSGLNMNPSEQPDLSNRETISGPAGANVSPNQSPVLGNSEVYGLMAGSALCCIGINSTNAPLAAWYTYSCGAMLCSCVMAKYLGPKCEPSLDRLCNYCSAHATDYLGPTSRSRSQLAPITSQPRSATNGMELQTLQTDFNYLVKATATSKKTRSQSDSVVPSSEPITLKRRTQTLT